jgi:hypothetical protein
MTSHPLIQRSLKTVSLNYAHLNDTDTLFLLKCIELTLCMYPYFIFPLGLATNIVQIILYSNSPGFRSSVMRLYLRRMVLVCMLIQTVELVIYLDLEQMSPSVRLALRFVFNVSTALFAWLLVVLCYAILDCFSSCNLIRSLKTKKQRKVASMFRKTSSTMQSIQNFSMFQSLYFKVICGILVLLLVVYSVNLFLVEASLDFSWSYSIDFVCVYALPLVFISERISRIVRNIRAKSRTITRCSFRSASGLRKVKTLQLRFLLAPVFFSIFALPYFAVLLVYSLMSRFMPSVTGDLVYELRFKLLFAISINWQLSQYSLLILVPLSFDRIFQRNMMNVLSSLKIKC